MLKEIYGIVFTWDLVENCILIGLCASGIGAVFSAYFVQSYVCFFALCAAAAGVWVVLYFSQKQVTPNDKSVLVTGCDSGFGHAVVYKLHDMGFKVFAACLDANSDGARKLRSIKSNRFHVIQMDVTSDESVERALKEVEKVTSKLWAVLNNAGIAPFGEVEWLSLDGFQNVIDINLKGLLRVTRAFLPLVRRDKGRVINVASCLGRSCNPVMSAYCVTKWGVEALSDCLRMEMLRWGVDVIVIEPGNYIPGTSIIKGDAIREHADKLWNTMMSDGVKKDYGRDYFDNRVQHIRNFAAAGDTDISRVIYAMQQAVSQKFPQRRYQAMDWAEKLRIFVYTHLPERVFELYIMGTTRF